MSPYPREFCDDVVRVARNRDDGVTIEQIATDFGVHPMTLHKWTRQTEIDEGAKPGKSTGESGELREARRRIRLLEQENRGAAPSSGIPVAGQSAGKGLYPPVKELAADGTPARRRAGYSSSPANRITAGWLSLTPSPNSSRPTAPTPCSTPTTRTPSSGTATSFIRLFKTKQRSSA